MESIEGKLSIELFARRPPCLRAAIRSSRPLQVVKLLHGKSPAQLLTTLPLLYSVCGVAQAHTALQAIEDAAGIEVDPRLFAARQLLVRVETAREHLLRVVIDWPRLLNLPVPTALLPQIGQLLPNFRRVLFGEQPAFQLDSQLQLDAARLQRLIRNLETLLEAQVFQMPLSQWLQLSDIDALFTWMASHEGGASASLRQILAQGWGSQGSAELEPLPPLLAEALLTRLNAQDADRFIAEPRWQGRCCETSVLSRQRQLPLIQALLEEFGAGLLSRSVARLLELAQIPISLRELQDQMQRGCGASQLPTGLGVAQTETARGRLIHRVEIDAGVISNYQIVAPTEWNFHPQGPVSRSLNRLEGDDLAELKRLAQLTINAIDPCVGYDLTIHP